MNKQKSKYFSTAALMDEALIALLEKKEIEYISVKEICTKAGVNRTTFYLHYETIEDLLEETMQYIMKKFMQQFPETTDDFMNKIKSANLEELKLVKESYLTPYLTFIKNNKKIFQASFSNPKGMKALEKYTSLEKHILLPILDRFSIPKEERVYRLAFYIRGIIGIIEKWLANDCQETIEKIETIIIRCVNYK